MTHWTSLAGVSLVALSLALPDPAAAQARSRGGDSSPSSGPSSSGQSSGSGGGDSSGPRSAPQGGSSGSARPRSGSGSGGDAGSVSSGAQTSATRGSSADQTSSGARARGSQPVRGEAQQRTGFGPNFRSRPTYIIRSYDPWYGYYDPWYGYGYGYGYGYSRWHRYPYGVGYGVFGMPYFYDPYWSYDYGGGGYSRRDDRDYRRDDRQPTGSIRFRANPRHARVYVDGALVGTVDEFDGLSDHLEIEAGRHQIELRADGYQSYTSEISVRAGRTTTERANLRKVN